MGITVYSLLWVMQDLYHQPYQMSVIRGLRLAARGAALCVLGLRAWVLGFLQAHS